MIVMKFGGSSISTSSLIKNVANIITQRIEYKPVVVVSAIGKTTRNLLKMAEEAASGNSKISLKLLGQLEEMHTSLMKESGVNHSECLHRQKSYLSELKLNLKLISNRRELSGLLKDKVLSFGELLSSNLIYASLMNYGLNPELLDARICMITDDHFSHACLYEDESAEKIRDYINPFLKKDSLPVIQGYIGSSKSGTETTLGFEGSDYTAVFIGAALGAEQIQIWKDVPGVMTADPQLISNARAIKKMSFDEAEELALCGAKILHPKSISPVRKSGIKISIHNTREPNATPTLIQNEIPIEQCVPKSVTTRNNLCVVKIHSNSDLNHFEFYKQVFDQVNFFELTPVYIQGRHEFLFLIIEEDTAISEFEKELTSVSTVLTEKNYASISLIGNNITKDKLFYEKICMMFNEDVLHYSLTENRKHSLTFIIGRKYLADLYQKIHDQFILT